MSFIKNSIFGTFRDPWKKCELNNFLGLLEDPTVEAFLKRDRCCVSIACCSLRLLQASQHGERGVHCQESLVGNLPCPWCRGGRGAEEVGDLAMGAGSQLAATSQVMGGRKTGLVEEDQLQGVCDSASVQSGDGACPWPSSLEQTPSCRPWWCEEDEEGGELCANCTWAGNATVFQLRCCRKKEGEEEEVDGNNLLLFS